MPLDDRQLAIIEASLMRIEARRRRPFTTEQRERVLEVADTELGTALLPGLIGMPANEQDQRVEGMVRLALVARGETIPVPDQITADVLARTPDSELPQLLYDYVCTWLRSSGAYEVRSDERYALVMKLPRGLRAVYLMCVFNGEVLNGALQQYFTNSNGVLAPETVACLRLVGANRHAHILDKGIQLWERARELWESAKGAEGQEEEAWDVFENEIRPEFDALEPAIDRLGGVELPFELLVVWLRSHPQESLTEP